MSETNENLLQLFTNLFSDTFNGMYTQVQSRFTEIEKNIEAIEKQIATLVLGYGEQAVFMEALVAQIAFASDEARKKFHEDIENARRNMLEVMRDASTELMVDDNKNIAGPIADMAAEKLSDTTK